METTHGLTYSVARAVVVTAWIPVNAICLCCLSNGSCVEVTGLHSLLICGRRWLECCDLSMPSPPTACAGPTCVQHALYIVARPDSQLVYTCVCFVISGAHNDVRAEGKGRSVQQPRKRLKFESVLMVVPLLFLARTSIASLTDNSTSKRQRSL